MESNSNLDQLQALVFDGGWDQESKDKVAELESTLQDIAIQENLAENAAIKPFIDYLTTEIERSEMLLKTHRSLDDRRRDELFARIDIATRFTSIFTGKARQSVEKEIKHMLDVASANAEALKPSF